MLSALRSISLCSAKTCSVTFAINSSSESADAYHPQSFPASEQLMVFVMGLIIFRDIYLIFQIKKYLNHNTLWNNHYGTSTWNERF